MQIIDERTGVRDVAARWKEQYYRHPGKWSVVADGSSEEIYTKLVALNVETATASDVVNIIGNPSWAGATYCHECGEKSDSLVEIGQPPDYESHTAEICRSCLVKALELIDSGRAPR